MYFQFNGPNTLRLQTLLIIHCPGWLHQTSIGFVWSSVNDDEGPKKNLIICRIIVRFNETRQNAWYLRTHGNQALHEVNYDKNSVT